MNEKRKAGAATEPAAPQVEIADNVFGPEMYADLAQFFSVKNGVVSIALASARWDNATRPAKAKHVIIGRLVMPLSGAQNLAVALWDYLKQRNLLSEAAAPGQGPKPN